MGDLKQFLMFLKEQIPSYRIKDIDITLAIEAFEKHRNDTTLEIKELIDKSSN